MGIIAHIIGLDEIHKHRLTKKFFGNVSFIDLDIIQQKIYNNEEITKRKQAWSETTQKIIIAKKQKNMIGGASNNIDTTIKELLQTRNKIRQEIHQIWRDKMSNEIDKQINNKPGKHIIFIGFNIFPKDYRVKINLPIKNFSVNNNNNQNRIVYETNPGKYASNQIKYYLKKYSDKIIRGKFPLNLLNTEYLSGKYDKFCQYYYRQGYNNILENDIYNKIASLIKHVETLEKIANQDVYVATLFKSADVIPVNAKTPIQGFLKREDAIANLKEKIGADTAIYIYKIKADQFSMVDGKLIATQPIYPMDEESILLS